ncbi:hypothetical protein GCM10025876_18790 [Demequina litorisediminis]|uniref:Flagellin n=1 Tax=Demequina litorisediminis TaxID=1849022 RepID=A0ABQ6ID84_9MICO|nr:hypothetical protein GCM10025876_18790 [Demequina litorisediminis]
MSLSINQNIAAVNSYRNLSNTQNDLSKSLEKALERLPHQPCGRRRCRSRNL